MKQKISYCALMFVSLCFVSSSCKKEAITESPVNNTQNIEANITLEDIPIIEGRLAFTNVEQFDAIKQMMIKKQDDWQQIEQQLNSRGFISSAEAYENCSHLKNYDNMTSHTDYAFVQDKDTESKLLPVITAPIMSRLVNAEGLLQIGSSITKYTRENAYMFDIANLPSYQNCSKSYEKINGVIIGKIQRTRQQIDNTSEGSSIRGFFEMYNKPGSYHKDQWFANWWVDSYPGPSSKDIANNTISNVDHEIYIEQHHDGRGFLGGWYNQKVDMSMSSSGTFSQVVNGIVSSAGSWSSSSPRQNVHTLKHPVATIVSTIVTTSSGIVLTAASTFKNVFFTSGTSTHSIFDNPNPTNPTKTINF